MTLLEIMDHMGSALLPHILSSPACPTPQGLEDISSSTLQWLQSHPPSSASWQLWTKTICSLYTGNAQSTCLHTPLGNWLATHTTHRFWKWQIYNPTTLITKQSTSSATLVALQSQCCHTMMKFTPTVPTDLPFKGPPITLLDIKTGYVPLPVLPIVDNPTSAPTTLLFSNYQQQFCEVLPIGNKYFLAASGNHTTPHIYMIGCARKYQS